MMIKEKVVFKNIVQSRNFVSDFGASIKNIIGGRLKTYEQMLDEGVSEAIKSLEKENPGVKDIKLQISELKNNSICITAYGVVKYVK